MVYLFMVRIEQTATFETWFSGLRDMQARGRIETRLKRIATEGFFGDSHPLKGGNLSELRFNVGPGYRIYYLVRGKTVVILLAGGDKKSQRKDIRLAKQLAEEV